MSKPICIHAWLARDDTAAAETHFYVEEPWLVATDNDHTAQRMWSRTPRHLLLDRHNGLRPGQIKRVVIVEDES